MTEGFSHFEFCILNFELTKKQPPFTESAFLLKSCNLLYLIEFIQRLEGRQ